MRDAISALAYTIFGILLTGAVVVGIIFYLDFLSVLSTGLGKWFMIIILEAGGITGLCLWCKRYDKVNYGSEV